MKEDIHWKVSEDASIDFISASLITLQISYRFEYAVLQLKFVVKITNQDIIYAICMIYKIINMWKQ